MNKTFLILFSAIMISFSVKAQKETLDNTPKVGLVLSGGGAKGFAHIGALKVIDSLNIKIDYIAGTSMGAIIGSLYASGYSGNQLDSIFKSLDFNKIISDDLPRGSKTFYERDNSEKYAVTLPFNKFKLKLPSALSRGQNVFNLLSKLTLHVNEVESFKDLPIPFFCIATNVETGEAVMLDKGNLAQALLASGAFPSLFQPVVINNKVLIDGGVVNNYPVDELRAKGMDVIIGVDVQDDLKTKEDLSSAPDVLLQINNFRTVNDMKAKVGKTEVYIKPDITDFSVVSFSEGDEIIESGKKATLLKLNMLSNLPRYSKENPKEEVKIVPKDSIKINRIGIFGNKKYTRSYIQGKLKIKPDTKVSYEDFNKGINNLVATNNFETFQYELKKSPYRKGYDLDTELKENKVTTFLKLGVHYDDLYKSAALANFTKKRVLFDNDILTLDVILGDNVRYNFEYFIDKGFHWSIGLKSRYNQFHKNINADLLFDENDQTFSGLNKVDVELKDQTNQFYLQTMIKKDVAFRIGAEHKRLNIKSETLVVGDQKDEFVFENTDYFSVFGSLKLDTYDDIYYPNKGVYFNGDFQWYLFASNFQ